MDVCGQTALVTLLPEKKLWISWSWRLAGYWRWSGCFGEEIVLLFLLRFEHQIFQRIFESLYRLLTHSDFKINVHFNKMRWEIWIECI
jgi:hypothetical protein